MKSSTANPYARQLQSLPGLRCQRNPNKQSKQISVKTFARKFNFAERICIVVGGFTAVAFLAANASFFGPTVTAVHATLIVAALFAFLPTMLAIRRQHHNKWAILVLNAAMVTMAVMSLGTLAVISTIGWIAAMVWSATAVHASAG